MTHGSPRPDTLAVPVWGESWSLAGRGPRLGPTAGSLEGQDRGRCRREGAHHLGC